MSKSNSGLQGLAARFAATWGGLARRERNLVLAASAVVGLALLWRVGIAPALATLRSAEAQHRSLDAQLASMQSLAAQAQSLQALPRTKGEDSAKTLDVAVKQHLGSTGQMSIVGERATVTLKGSSGAALAAWLAAARSNARALPSEAKLVQNAARTGWDGSVVLTLPPP